MKLDVESGTWDITDTEMGEFKREFPHVDVDSALRRSAAWCRTAGKKGQKKNWSRFFSRWLLREKPKSSTVSSGYAETFKPSVL